MDHIFFIFCEIKLHFKNYRDGTLIVRLLNSVIEVLMVAKNLKCTTTKDIFVHIFRIFNVVAHLSKLDNGPPCFLS